MKARHRTYWRWRAAAETRAFLASYEATQSRLRLAMVAQDIWLGARACLVARIVALSLKALSQNGYGRDTETETEAET